MVEVVETAESPFAPANDRVGSVDEAVGRVTAKAIPQRVAVLKSMLAPEGTPPGMVGRIPAGYRAVAVKIDEATSVAYQVKPGDWVDVIVVMDIATSARGRKETIAEVILQNVQVGAIGRGADKPGGESTGKVKPAKSATLFVPEDEVPKLHLAATRGKITLSLRGEDSLTTDSPARADLGDVIPMIAPPSIAAAKPAEPSVLQRDFGLQTAENVQPHDVVVVRGSSGKGGEPTSVETITFEGPRSPVITGVSAGHPANTGFQTGTSKRMARPRSDSQPTPQNSPSGAGNDTEPNDE
jgi:Flp pilus assembly protein CpaB